MARMVKEAQTAALKAGVSPEVLAREVPGAKAVRLDTAHLSNLEQPRAFTAAILEFLLQR